METNAMGWYVPSVECVPSLKLRKEMSDRYQRYQTKHALLAAAATWMASDQHLEANMPGPHDDAEMEYRDEHLLEAARTYVKEHEGVKTAAQMYRESYSQVSQTPPHDGGTCKCNNCPCGKSA